MTDYSQYTTENIRNTIAEMRSNIADAKTELLCRWMQSRWQAHLLTPSGSDWQVTIACHHDAGHHKAAAELFNSRNEGVSAELTFTNYNGDGLSGDAAFTFKRYKEGE